MKRIFSLLTFSALLSAASLSAQDAATEERLNKINGVVEDLKAANGEQQKKMAALAKEIQELRDRLNHPKENNYATQDDVKRLAEKLQEIDKKRQEDKELIIGKIADLAKVISGGSPKPKKSSSTPADTSSGDKPVVSTDKVSDKGFEYVIQEGDYPAKIVKAYAAKNIKVTVKQILDANPGLNPNKMVIGQKIFIPAPQQ